MSKVYLYSNIILAIISIIALILSILDIIVKESGQQQDGCPKSECTINAESITAKNSKFDRINSDNINSTITINTLSNLNLENTRIGNLISENININKIVNNVDLSNNSITIGANKVLKFNSFSFFVSDIGTTNLSSNNISCVTSNFSNLSATSINSSNSSGSNLKTTDASFKDIKGNYVKCTNATFTNISFIASSATNISFSNPSVTKLTCTNCTIYNISSTLNVSVSNIYYKSLQCTNMNTKGSLLSVTNITFTNLLNKSIIKSENFITDNINGLNDLYFDRTNNIINCSNIVGLANFSFSNYISSTNNLVNNIYKFGDFTNLLDAYIKNLTCTDLITKDTIFIDNLPLNDTYTNLESNNINYTINIETILKTPFTRDVVNNTPNNLLLQVDINPSKKIYMIYATYNSTKSYDFSSCLYIFPGNGYYNIQPNTMDLQFSSNVSDLTLFSGMSFRCIFDTIFKAPSFPYVLKIFNKIRDFTLEVISNKNIYDKSTKFSQNIITNGEPASINIYKGENNLDFLINVIVTCTNVDMINKKIVFLILPI